MEQTSPLKDFEDILETSQIQHAAHESEIVSVDVTNNSMEFVKFGFVVGFAGIIFGAIGHAIYSQSHYAKI